MLDLHLFGYRLFACYAYVRQDTLFCMLRLCTSGHIVLPMGLILIQSRSRCENYGTSFDLWELDI